MSQGSLRFAGGVSRPPLAGRLKGLVCFVLGEDISSKLFRNWVTFEVCGEGVGNASTKQMMRMRLSPLYMTE